VAPDHPELIAARTAGIPAEPWQQVVADAHASQGGRLIAVAGTHGKSTSAGWLVHVLAATGHDPAAFVGALLPAALAGGIPATSRWGRGDAFVVEADEYAGNFDAYRPDVALLLNAEWDHPDVFPDESAVLDAFEGWLRAPGATSRTIVANIGDMGVARLLGRLPEWPGGLVTVALAPSGGQPRPATAAPALPPTVPPPIAGRLGSDGAIVVDGLPGASGPVRLVPRLPGRHNAVNAVCVAATAALAGVPPADLPAAIAGFPGVGRRLEVKGEPRGVLVLDDYGHHPTAIAASLAAVRSRWPGRRLWAVYEPLTYHRTAAMLDAFADVLATADRAVIADIWPGRDPDTTITSAAALADAITRRGGPPALAPGSVEATADALAAAVAPGDIVLVMGGGHSYVIADRLVARLGG
jgi:UDP-N-acetylmuramate--alanine ligase